MEHLVYIKENSITNELIDELMEIYEENENEDEEENQDILMIHPNCKKIQKYLLNEIQQEIIKYFEKINGLFGEKKLPYEWRNNVSSFLIKNEDTTDSLEHITQKTVEKFRKKEIKMFYFLWFLNDNDEEYIFPNGQTAKHKKGTLIIIPCSPFFSFYINKTIQIQKQLNINGYIYTNERIH